LLRRSWVIAYPFGQGVRGRYEANPDVSGTLEALVKHEARDPIITHKHGTACLVRLIRYAEYLQYAVFVGYNVVSLQRASVHVPSIAEYAKR